MSSLHAAHRQWGLCANVIVHTIFPPSPVILWIELGGKPKWPPLKFGHLDVMRTSLIFEIFLFHCIKLFCYPVPSQAHFLKVDFNKWRDSDDEDDGGLDDAGFDAVSCDCFPERCLAGRAQKYILYINA